MHTIIGGAHPMQSKKALYSLNAKHLLMESRCQFRTTKRQTCLTNGSIKLQSVNAIQRGGYHGRNQNLSIRHWLTHIRNVPNSTRLSIYGLVPLTPQS